MYYLDTSAARAMGKRLLDCSLLGQSSISVVTLIELLAATGRSTEEYRRCRAVARILVQGGLEIEWTMPDVKVGVAFPALRQMGKIEDERPAALRVLLQQLCDSDGPKSFRKSCDLRGLGEYGLGYFEEYDRTFGTEFNLASAPFERELKRQLQLPDADEQLKLLGLPPGLTVREFSFRFAVHPLNFAISIHAAALKIAEHVERSDEAFVRALYESYDRSIDCYLLATSVKSMERPATGAVPGRNDALDLAHFTYLNSGTALVSDDVAMRALGKAVGVEALNSQGFLTGG